MGRCTNFLKCYLSRASQMVGDWVVYMEPVKAGRKGYHAVAKVDRITPDPSSPRNAPRHHLIRVRTSTSIAMSRSNQAATTRNEAFSTRQATFQDAPSLLVRPIPPEDFNRIVGLGLDTHDELLPRSDAVLALSRKNKSPYEFEQDRVQMLTTAHRARLEFSERACSKPMTVAVPSLGFQFINGGGRAEVEAPTSSPCRTRARCRSKSASLFPAQSIGCLIGGLLTVAVQQPEILL